MADEYRVGFHEWYSKWALQSMQPCIDCPPEYTAAYSALQEAVAAGCIRSAYRISTGLARMNREYTNVEHPHPERRIGRKAVDPLE